MNADLIRSHLLERILPFWERHSIDREAGGFWTQLARDGSRVGAGRKMLVMQARMIYAFATAYRLTGEERYLEIASCGADFLRGRFRDTRHGGWFWAADRAGEPIDRSKRVYGQAFVAYALAEYGRLAGDSQAVAEAGETLLWMEEFCQDRENGGLILALTEAGQPTDTTKRLDIHLHAMEAAFALYHATGEKRFLATLRLLCDTIRDHMQADGGRCLREWFLADWRENLAATRGDIGIGHNLEAAWFLTAASAALEDPSYRPLADRCLEFALCWGWDAQSGGFFDNAAPDGRITRSTKIWWVQAEGFGALSLAYRLTGQLAYLEYLERLWRFCSASFHDAQFGEWYTYLDADGGALDDHKGSDWKAAYHIVQGLAHAWWNLTASGGQGVDFCL